MINLPEEVSIKKEDLLREYECDGVTMDDLNDETWYDVSEYLTDYLTNEYEFCILGLDYEMTEDTFEVSNIFWDISE